MPLQNPHGAKMRQIAKLLFSHELNIGFKTKVFWLESSNNALFGGIGTISL